MARKPVHLLAACKKPVGRQAIWQAIRTRRSFTARALWGDTDIPMATIKSYLKGLAASGHITPRPDFGGFALVNDVGVEAPRVTRDGKPVTQGLARENMWRTMKMLGSDFTAAELSIAASTEAVRVSEVDAKDYCRNLALAAYLIVISKGKGTGKGAVPSRYRFNRARNTGPKAPMVQRMQTVFDPNLGEIVWHPDVDA
jgi:hypothetical protein